MSKRNRREVKPRATGPCLLPAPYVWAAVTLTIAVMVVVVILILRGERPLAACAVVAAIGAVAAGLIRRILGQAGRTA
jgi:hypothetical protein